MEAEQRIGEGEDKVTTLRREVTKLQQSVNKVVTKNEELEGRSRRNNIRILGVPESTPIDNMEMFVEELLVETSGVSLVTLALFFTVFVLLFDFMKRRRSWSGFPPGPPSMPFLGSMLQVDFQKLPDSFAQLRKKYGDVFSLQFCWTNVVVLSGFETVKEGLISKSEDTSDRPHFPVNEYQGYKENCSGVVIARYGHSWRDVRRFTLSTLRNFGVGKKTLEQRVVEEAGFLCSAFKSKEGRPFDPHFMIRSAVCNVISSIVFGDRFEYSDTKLQKVLRIFDEILVTSSEFRAQLLNVVPALLHVPGAAAKILRMQGQLFNFLKEIIEEHKQSWDPNVRRDFIDAFIEETEKMKGDPISSFSEKNLLFTISDLFTAGTETTTITLRLALLYMILYPDVQSRVQEELDQVIGRERPPTMEDRANMPYTNAVVHEIQRFGDIIPFSVPHMTSRDTEVHGFFIPKGTTLMFNLTSVLKDESIWERPYQFYPEHFLDADGQFVKREAFMPFSAGRRICLGERLATMELFLFFTSFLQQFTFHVPRDQPRPSEQCEVMFMRVPQHYQLCAKVR
ncbi:cytochrome P450 2D15-like [Ambystoma mexicanum]|uniref:cytochrome P450 2D15-like n=1 Tax=Ambystoma mexicanum TaxID=8296 RepID=UPI0037E9287C